MERWKPWGPAPVPAGGWELTGMLYARVWRDPSEPDLTLEFSDGERGVRVTYERIHILRTCRASARPAPAGEESLADSLAYTAEDSDFRPWAFDEDLGGIWCSDECDHHVFRAGGDVVDVLSLSETPRFEPIDPAPPGAARPVHEALAPAVPEYAPGPVTDTWRSISPPPAAFPEDEYELSTIERRGEGLRMVLQGNANRIEISHASALAFRTSYESLRFKSHPGEVPYAATLFYRVEESSFAAWASVGQGPGLPRPAHYAYIAYQDDTDVLAWDEPSVTVAPLPPEWT